MPRVIAEIAGEDGWTRWINTEAVGISRGNKQVVDNSRFKKRIICCDCGLAHDLEFHRVGSFWHFRARRNERSTANMRKGKKQKRK